MSPDPSLDALLRRAAPLLPAFAHRSADALRPWADRPFPIQLCLRDVWHDHVLFTDDRVTGLIDYGAVGHDHPAGDLARLLTDLVGLDPDRIRFAVDLYHAAGGDRGVTAEFVFALANAGLAGSVLSWVDRIATGLPASVSVAAVTDRLTGLVATLEAAGEWCPSRTG